MTFESVDENAYVSADGEVRIQKNAEVRVRVVGMRIDASEIFCIATIGKITSASSGRPRRERASRKTRETREARGFEDCIPHPGTVKLPDD